jgi:undecaprenyl phosphate N,N'-diacetylbacillosamine 1-phosphate transferase
MTLKELYFEKRLFVNQEESIKDKYESTKYKKGYEGIYQKIIKRFFDLLISILILPLLLLILIPVAIAIKLEDGGPIFYHSIRLGIGFNEFAMIKFRSMKINAPDIRNTDGSTFNSSNDPRVTKVGRFLRETSIDEIPQIFNVIIGDMSIIGPRPGDVESKNSYKLDEADKLLIRPGITGYTQSYYRNSLGVREKRLYDAWYAHNVTFILDLKILCKTIVTVFKRKNLYTNS